MAETTIGCEATIDGEAVVVLAAEVALGISELGHAECEVTDRAGGPLPSAVIGKPFVIRARRDDDESEHAFAGIIVEAELSGDDSNAPHLRVRVAPRMWRLGKRVGYRIFQEMSVVDVVKDVLERAGIDAGGQDWQLTESYPVRTYCLQHRESELDFVMRLLAEEGIAFGFEERDGEDVVWFTDADLGPVGGVDALVYRERSGFHHAGAHVWDLVQARSVRSDGVSLRDFDFERPDLQIEHEELASDGTEGTLSVYDFPGRSIVEAELTRMTRVLLEALRCDRERIQGHSGALHLYPGRRFTVSEHPYEPMNQELLIVRTRYRHAGTHAGQRQRGAAQGFTFEAIPAAVPFRPPRRERGRSVAGFDTAVVTGAPGEEIHPDRHGRVKAQHHWDREGARDDKSSAFMRTTQLPLGGSLLTPRVGFEGAVCCAEGDPDAPIVTGRLYNAEWPPPYPLPAGKTRSSIQTGTSPGGGSSNEIRMEDAAGSEEMFMNASRDMSVSAGNNATEAVVGNETRSIGANQSISVTGSAQVSIGASQAVNVGGNQKAVATSYMVNDVSGAHTLTIGGSRDVKAGGDHRQSIAGSASLSVGSNRVDLVVGHVTDATLAAMNDTIGAAFVDLTASSRSVAVEGARTEKTGAAKIVVTKGGRGTKCASLTHNVAGAVLYKTKGDLADNASGDFVDLAGGAQIIKADNVTFAAENLLTVVCGASTLTLTPGSVTVAGASISVDGTAPELAALVKDN